MGEKAFGKFGLGTNFTSEIFGRRGFADLGFNYDKLTVNASFVYAGKMSSYSLLPIMNDHRGVAWQVGLNYSFGVKNKKRSQ